MNRKLKRLYDKYLDSNMSGETLVQKAYALGVQSKEEKGWYYKDEDSISDICVYKDEFKINTFCYENCLYSYNEAVQIAEYICELMNAKERDYDD